MKNMNFIVIAALAVAAVGCVSHPVVEPYPIVQIVNDSGSNAKAEQAHIDATTVQPLRVLVSIDGGDKEGDAYALSGYLRSGLEGALAARGYRVVYEGDHEILVSTCGPITCLERNRRGTRSVYYGDADIEVTRAAVLNTMTGQTMRNIVARQRFDVQGGEARTRAEAIKSVADALGPELANWAAASVSSVAGSLARCEVSVSNAWSYGGEESYPSRFVATVSRMGGVYLCRVLTTDNASRSFRAELIYDKNMYPDGIVNGLIATSGLDLHR